MRRFHLITVLVVALLGGVAALAIAGGWEPNRGLDLQGGLEVVLEAQALPGSEITDSDLDRSIEIMRSRVDKLGVAEPEIRKQPPNQIIIELPGIKDPERAAELVGQTAQLAVLRPRGRPGARRRSRRRASRSRASLSTRF